MRGNFCLLLFQIFIYVMIARAMQFLQKKIGCRSVAVTCKARYTTRLNA
ncbi:hypothetical protein OIU79_003780 [Salix purpurea]|uniref:Uncharacterized protein n=1 Tax=Salix purpurea TaxID=77065 RepID=A0A9Q0U8M9_SALPP|nr:hypothetical protein OIU79_003780 [Salix purpurea]